MAILNLAEEKATTYRAIGNVQTEYSLPWIEGLRANLNLGFDVTEAERENFTPERPASAGGRAAPAARRPATIRARSTPCSRATSTTPRRARWAPGTLDLTGGYSWTKTKFDSLYFEATGLDTDALGNDGIPAADQVKNILYVQESKLISFFGRANYNINDKYLAAFSIRRDGSSRFGAGNDYGTFPSVALAWRLSQEPFLRGVEGALRPEAPGLVGQDRQPVVRELPGLVHSYQIGDGQTQYQFGDSLFTTSRPSAVDPNIKWEATRAFNLGLDFGFGNQRFSGAIDWYGKLTDDLLFTVPVAGFSNLSNFVTTNIGSMRNRGVELSLSARMLEGGRGRD